MHRNKPPSQTINDKINTAIGAEKMPVNAAVFPADLIKKAEAKANYVAVYIVAPRDQKWPVSFGITSDPVATYHAFQKGWWEEHCLHVLLWTPSRKEAEKVKKTMVEMMHSQRRFFSRSWYDVAVEDAERALRVAAAEQKIQLFDEVEKQRRIYFAVQKAWEKRMGIQAETTDQSVASNVLTFTRGRPDAGKRKH